MRLYAIYYHEITMDWDLVERPEDVTQPRQA
jgi:hypothetical protein